jgi:hypothetical protein
MPVSVLLMVHYGLTPFSSIIRLSVSRRKAAGKARRVCSQRALTSVERVNPPVLILQERSDTTALLRQIDKYERGIKVCGKQIEFKWFDVDHLGSFAQAEQAIEQQEEISRFTYRVVAQAARP